MQTLPGNGSGIDSDRARKREIEIEKEREGRGKREGTRKVVRELPRIRDVICTAGWMYLESATAKMRAKGANLFRTLRTSNGQSLQSVNLPGMNDWPFCDNCRLANSPAAAFTSSSFFETDKTSQMSANPID